MSIGRAYSASGRHAKDDILLSFSESLRAWTRGQHAKSDDQMRVAISMKIGQAALFRKMGFVVPSVLGCWARTDDAWAQSGDGQPQNCCLFLGRTNSRTKGEVEVSKRHQHMNKVGHCAPMPTYGLSATTHEFICPLKYARLS